MSDEPEPEAPEEEPEPEPEPEAEDEEPEPEPEPVPTVNSILPNNVKVGGEDLVLSVYGTGFTENTVILFNNGEEPTTFVEPTRVTTIVKPSTASGPMILPVSVKGAAEFCNFAFLPEDPTDPNTYTDSESPIGGGPLV